MKWIQENPFLAGLAGALVVLGGGLAFLLFQALSGYTETSEAYNAAVLKLHGLQERVPYPNEENLAKARALHEEMAKEASAFHAQLAKMELPVEKDTTAQKFQDDLRDTVDRIKERAKLASVSLPENFYLGFDQYRTSLPTDKAAPALSRQLAVINLTVNNLIDFKVASINDLKRQPLPEEPVPTTASGEAPGGPANRGNAQPGVVSRYPFDISFTAEQGKFRLVFNSLLNAEQFLIVRALSVQNSQPASPSRNAPEAESTPPPAAEGEAPAAAANASKITVVFGREMVHVALRVEMVDFVDPKKETAKK